MKKRGSRRLIAFSLMASLTLTVTTEGRSWAAPAGGGGAGGGAGGPAGKTLESFHSDLATGRALFSIPLAVPPGRRGIQPSIGLAYSSSDRNGPIGVGWNLELGSVERSTRFGPPKFDAGDVYVLKSAGVTADLVQTTPGEYRMEDEQAFSRIRFDGTAWTVTSKDGSKVTLGGTPDSVKTTSRGVVGWLANRVQDVHGNTLTITYTADTGQVYPASILYTAHPATGLAAQREVRFTWETRPDVEWDERFGDRIETRRRLQRVECLYQGVLVRRYDLAYTAGPLTGRSLLAGVTTIGSDGSSSLPPVRLRYTDGWGGWLLSPSYAAVEGAEPVRFVKEGFADTGRRLEDITSDGLADLLIGDGADRRFYRNTGQGWTPQPENGYAPPHSFLDSSGGETGARFADFNGDGRVDLYYGRPGMPGAPYAYLNTGSGWQKTEDWNETWYGNALLFTTWNGADNGMRFVELNGDGKTDLLQAKDQTLHCWLNNGTDGFTENFDWVPPKPFLVGDNDPDQGARFADLNGDGLTDLFYAGPGENAAYLNTGRGWRREVSWNSGPFAGESFISGAPPQDQGWRLLDANGDGLADLVRAKTGQPFRALINTGRGWTEDNRFIPQDALVDNGGYDNGGRLGDLNGDGVTDILWGYAASQRAWCWTSATGILPAIPPDLLVEVENGLGGSTRLTYRPSSEYNNSLYRSGVQGLPFVTQTVASQTVSNGLGWSATTSFTYLGGWFNPVDREFLGFAWARATDPAGSTAESWFHQDAHLKGRPYRQETKDAAGNLYTLAENTWACGCESLPPGVHFCHLDSTTSTVYDGDFTSRRTRVRYEYDAYGNVTRQVEEGDTAVTGDERTVVTEYVYNPDAWLMAHPARITVTDAAGTKISESRIFYDGSADPAAPPARGLVTKAESWLSTGPANPTAASTYDACGNKLASTDAMGRVTTTAYDPAEQLFPIKVTNALGHTLETTYDPGSGLILTTTDPNGQVTKNRYDALGRFTAVIGPLDTDAAPSVRYEYDLSSLPTRATKRVKASPFGVSLSNPEHYYTSHTFADGLGRVIQARLPAQDPAQQIVQGCVEFGRRGEVTAQYLPHFQPASTGYSLPPSGTPKVLYGYDAMGRHIRTTDPDGAVSSVAYSDWTVTATDALGNTTVKESDAYGRLIRVTEPSTADHGASVTNYIYDPAGRLVRVTDAVGNVTQIAYDSLGRKLSMDDPDMAHWTYEYDIAGNMLRQTDAKGQVLEFEYDPLNRLLRKTGSVRGEPVEPRTVLAAYLYDDPAKPFCVGRLSRVTDPSGSTEFWYDLLGREVKTVKVILGSSFTVQREYDPLNRLTRLLYPDGTDLRYTYSPQGITRVHGINAGGSSSDFVSHASYNAAGETLRIEFGNGVATDYTYDAGTLRIAGIRTANSANQTLQDFSYGFDAAGNLTALTDHANSASQTFQYDALNRLRSAGGPYGPFSFRYDPTGNLLEKDNGMALTYGRPGGAGPHAAMRCSAPAAAGAPAQDVTLAYDANGCLISKVPLGVSPSASSGQALSNPERHYSYDLENRLVEVMRTEPSPQISIPLTLRPGWNCIGLPFDTTGRTFEQILHPLRPGVDYNRIVLCVPGKSPSRPKSSDAGAAYADIPALGQGFWVHVTNKSASVTLNPSGSLPHPQRYISLIKGWNPIAVPTGSAISAAQALEGLTSGTDYSEIKRHNPATRKFDRIPPSAELRPGETLWVQMRKAKTWVYPTPASSPNRTVTRFTYDSAGSRVRVTTSAGATTTIGELYEVAPGGITRSHIFFGPTRIATFEREEVILAQVPGTFGTRYRFLSEGVRFTRRALAKVEEFFVGSSYADVTLPASMKISYYHGDHLGSVNVVTDHTGAQVRLQEFAPFGKTVRTEPPPVRTQQVPGTVPVPGTDFGFTGKRLDPSTGLYYYGARYYDPELGRFIQPDSIVQAPSDPQTLNRYTYCRNSPLVYTDPTGHSFWKKLGRALGAIGRVIVSAVVAAVTFVATGGNIPAAAAAFSFTNTFLSASAQGASFGRAFGASAAMATAAYFGTNYALGAGPFAGAFMGASFGAAGSAASAAILGASPGRAALSGAVGGAIMGGLGGAYGMPGYIGGAAAAGAASAAVANGNVGQGAYLGAIGAVTFAIASASFQEAIDLGRSRAGQEADSAIANAINGDRSGSFSRFSVGREQPAESALTVDSRPSPAARLFGKAVFEASIYAAAKALRFTGDVLNGAAGAAAAFGVGKAVSGDPITGGAVLFTAGVTKMTSVISHKTADLLEKLEYPYSD